MHVHSRRYQPEWERRHRRTHRLAFGAIGRNGTYAANDATKHADVILALGFSFDDRATSAWLDGYTLAIPPSRLIQIDTILPTGPQLPAQFPILGWRRQPWRPDRILLIRRCSPLLTHGWDG